MRYNFVAIEGNIGAGKTTLAKKLAENYNAKLILEQFEENPFLAKFYENPARYSFQLEVSFLVDRFLQFKYEISHQDLFKNFTVSDYYISKSLLFAKNNLHEQEYGLYKKIFELLSKAAPQPDLLIYLYVNIEQLLTNIKTRKREYELKISRDYLENIQNIYMDFLKKQKNMRILILEINNFNFYSDNSLFVEKIFDLLNIEYKLGLTSHSI
jgi:deoxyadenosine/deoxycytidine kinase